MFFPTSCIECKGDLVKCYAVCFSNFSFAIEFFKLLGVYHHMLTFSLAVGVHQGSYVRDA